MRTLLIALAVTAPALTAGCVGGSPEEPPSVRVDEQGFDRERLEVEVGTKIGWENRDDREHTITILGRNLSANESREQVVLDERLEPGRGQLYTFDETGDYVVYCEYHGSPGEGERMAVNVTPQPGGTTYDPRVGEIAEPGRRTVGTGATKP